MTAGPGLWVRITHRFGPRQMEWFMAWITAMLGAVLMLPADTFAAADAWVVFQAISLSEWTMGAVLFVTGFARLVGLVVNGARKEITPWIRVATAFLGFVIWVGFTTGFAFSGVVGPWLAFFPTFAVAELVNIYRAAHDAGEAHGSS